MPDYSNVGWATTPDIEYVVVDDVADTSVDEGPETVTIHGWDDAVVWYDGQMKSKLPKDLREALGEPDWEI